MISGGELALGACYVMIVKRRAIENGYSLERGVLVKGWGEGTDDSART